MEFSQSADRSRVGLEETFQLSIVVVNPPPNAQLELPSSHDFEILQRFHESQLLHHRGRKTQTELRHLLILRAKKEGRLLIPAALLKTEKTTYKTETVAIDVIRSQTANASSPRANLSQGSSPTNTPLIPRSDSDLFVQMTLNKPSAYVGEQVLLTLQVYSRTTNITLQSISMPTLNGFFNEDFALNWPLPAERKTVDGVSYYVTILKQQALFAIQPGSYTVEPATVDFTMGQLFRGRKVLRKSNALTLEIKALPSFAEKLPIGQWTLELQTPQSPSSAGQPVEFNLTLQGIGNIKNVPPLELQFPKTFKTFQPTIQNTTQVLDNKLLGKRTMQYVVIPQEAGNFTVPAVKFDHFNPETETLDSAHTLPLSLVVLPGTAGHAADHAAGNMPLSMAPNAELPEQKIHPIRHKAQLAPPLAPLTQKSIYWLLVALPIALRFLGRLLRFAFSKMGSSEKQQQRKREKSTINTIESLLGELEANPNAASFSNLGKNLMALLELKLGSSIQGLRREHLHAKMQAQGLSESLCKQILYVLAECDAIQFGHGPPSPDKVLAAMLHVLKEWP
ncbi:MAG: BatD family protein [Cystobacterineae bacterium]|nr:BatD family protein [Cystobacterineae bacterium]